MTASPLPATAATSLPATAAPRVVIVGGGFSGAAVALHLARRAPGRAAVTIVEPRAEIGRGVAYDAIEPQHRLNVPDYRMEVFADDPEQFRRWFAASPLAQEDPGARDAVGNFWPSRRAFGSYVNELVAALRPKIAHVRARATAIVRVGRGYAVSCDDGRLLAADLVVLAVCHPPPAPPRGLATLAGDPRLIADPWAPMAFATVAPDERILIVGTGLTMADVVASLAQRGHRGAVTAISRRGQRSHTYADRPVEPFGDFATAPSRTALALLRRVRATVAEAAAAGEPWQGVLDQVRLQGRTIWQALPPPERLRLLRHLRPFWDTHRFRIAPQVKAAVDGAIAAGRMTVRAAGVVSAKATADGIEVVLKLRGRAQQRITVDRVVLANGPAHDGIFAMPLLAQLRATGLAHPDAYGLGIAVDGRSRVLDDAGAAQPRLFVAGPLARGTFGELMGVPDLSPHADGVATAIAAELGLVSAAGAG
jgi:uncharacterized NAD(P)/FAD-binding protein YdhS